MKSFFRIVFGVLVMFITVGEAKASAVVVKPSINMNGRMYDPVTAQFLSPDPYVQMPDNPLNYNRYAYCIFNPIMYTA